MPSEVEAERSDWRSSLFGAAIVTILAGIWLALSAAPLDYGKPALPIVCGVVIIVVGVLRLVAAPGSRILALVSAVAGALTVLTAFVASDPPGPTANMALMGLAVMILAFIGLSARDSVSAAEASP